jgi:hypothetical protein
MVGGGGQRAQRSGGCFVEKWAHGLGLQQKSLHDGLIASRIGGVGEDREEREEERREKRRVEWRGWNWDGDADE